MIYWTPGDRVGGYSCGNTGPFLHGTVLRVDSAATVFVKWDLAGLETVPAAALVPKAGQ